MMTQTTRFNLSILTATLAAIVLPACAAKTQLISRLDVSGLTVVTLDEPMLLARPVPRLAAAARDYAYLGPVEINRMGNREHFLWLGLASTIDRELAGVPQADVQTLAVLLDDRPMLLPLVQWVAELDQSPYETVAPLDATFAARASLDQIRRMSAAKSVEVHLVSTSGVSWRYEKWQGDWSSWNLLVASK